MRSDHMRARASVATVRRAVGGNVALGPPKFHVDGVVFKERRLAAPGPAAVQTC